MTIRRKVLLGAVAACLLTVLAGWAAIRYLGMKAFDRLEQERAAYDMGRAAAALDNELEHMQASLRFKAASDITYRFAADRDPALAAQYFSWESLKGGGLNLMALFDGAGKLAAGAAFDLRTREAVPLETLLAGFPKEIITAGKREQGRGLLMTSLGPLLVTWQPVLNSLGWGPPRGTFLSGRLADQELLGRLGAQLGLGFAILPLESIPRDLAAKARESYRNGGGPVREAEVPESLTALAIHPDFQGVPSFALKVSHQRSDTTQFARAVRVATLFVGLAGLLVLAVGIWLLQTTVLTPLGRITGHIEGVKDRGGLDKPLELERPDEIGRLARAFNAMSADLAGLYDRLDRQHGLLTAIIDSIPHPISVKDAFGRYLVANRAQAELLDRAGSQVIGASDADLAPGAPWAAQGRAREEAVLATGEPSFTPVEAVGTHLYETTRLALAAPGQDSGQVLTVRLDSTARLLSEKNLRESEKKFRSLFDSMTEGVSLHEVFFGDDDQALDYRILDVNPSFERILGISRQKAVGALASELYGTGDPPFLHIYAEVASTGKPMAFEVYFAPMNKHFHVSAFCPQAGQFATVFMDTTQDRRNREALERARLEMQHILDSMPSPVIGVDERGNVAHVNAAAGRLLQGGSTGGEGLPMAVAFPGLAGQAGLVGESMDTGSPGLLSRQKLDLGGEPRLVDIQVFPMRAAGRTAGAVVRLDDVTERVRMEEVVLQTEKMMSVGGLAAGMAHEINNPLGGILQSVQIIHRRLDPGLAVNAEAAAGVNSSLEAVNAYLHAREIPRFLEAIQDAGTRAARIVTNMLEFSRRSESKLASCDLDRILEKALELAASDYDLKKRYDFKLIEIVRQFDTPLPKVRCTQTELEQVALNLIRNAAQAVAGGAVGGSPRIVLRAINEGDHVRMEVEDNGPGMSEAVRKRVFEPFFTTKAPGVGTGLGLSVSYFIVTQNHGGEMYVESEPGKGARFVVRVPCSPPPPVPSA